MKLIIAEKPSLGKAIGEWLGIKKSNRVSLECNQDYVVTWLFGHMLQLYDAYRYNPDWKYWTAQLPIRPKEFLNDIKDDAGIKAQVKVVKDLLKTCSEILHTGDPDREGQLLVDELLEFLGNTKPVKRLWLSAIDDKSIAKAFNEIKPNSEFYGYKLAAKMRQEVDWLIGINFTRAFTLRFQANGYGNAGNPISIGRVQTPTLKLIVDRDNEIKNFKAKDFFELEALFSDNTNVICSKLVVPEAIKSLMDDESRLLDRKPLEELADVIKSKIGTVSEYSKDTKTTKQPLLFNLAKLQSTANNKYGYSAQLTLDVAQVLYENKLISYPRSDCQYMPESQFSDAAQILQELCKLEAFADLKPVATIKSQVWNDTKITAHHAIVPTGANLNNLAKILSGLASNIKSKKDAEEILNAAPKIFELVCLQYITQFYPEAKYDEVAITFSLNHEDLVQLIKVATIEFKTIGRTIIDMGWKKLHSQNNDDSAGEADNNQLLPVLDKGQQLTCSDTKLLAKKTTKPKSFTEGMLIEVMSNIHNRIPEIVKQLGYNVEDTTKLIKEYKSILKETAGLGTEATRAGIIKHLKEQNYIKEHGKNLISTDLATMLINSMHVDGKIHELGFLASPLTTAQYEQSLDEIARGGGNDVIDSFWQSFNQQIDILPRFSEIRLDILVNPNAEKCSKCSSVLKPLKGKFGQYWRCVTCNINYKDNNGKPIMTPKAIATATGEKCPECTIGNMVERQGKFGKFIACDNYPSCKYIQKAITKN